MEQKKETYTNEKLSKKFVSQFDLVNYAIRLAENMIRSGRETRVKTEHKNRAMQILMEITQDKDVFDEIPETEQEYEEGVLKLARQAEERAATFTTNAKYAEKKKSRKIFSE